MAVKQTPVNLRVLTTSQETINSIRSQITKMGYNIGGIRRLRKKKMVRIPLKFIGPSFMKFSESDQSKLKLSEKGMWWRIEFRA